MEKIMTVSLDVFTLNTPSLLFHIIGQSKYLVNQSKRKVFVLCLSSTEEDIILHWSIQVYF